MKRKYIALLTVMLALLFCFLGCGKDAPNSESVENTQPSTSNEPGQTTEATESTSATTESEPTTSEETEPTVEAVVLESTPDSIVLEVEAEDGSKFQVQIGGTMDSELPDESDGVEQPVQTQPTEPKPTETQPVETVTPPTFEVTAGPDRTTTFEAYEAMSEVEQLVFYYSFADANDFYAWYNAAKAEHEANNGDIIIG